MSYTLWQAADEPVGTPRTARVRNGSSPEVPDRLEILASVSDADDLRGSSAYIQLAVPGYGPVLAWVGLPHGGARQGHFVHPESGRTWPWGSLARAVEFVMSLPNTTLEET